MKRFSTDARYELHGKASVTAYVSVFDNVDHGGDVVRKGSFANSIARWKSGGHPIPAIFSHQWQDPFMHIGEVTDLEETDHGLKATYDLDVEDNAVAKQVHSLMKKKRIRQHSFAYDVVKERRAADGANELLDLQLIEVGPTLRGMNSETDTLAVKSAIDEWRSGRYVAPAPGLTYNQKAFANLSAAFLELANDLREREPDAEPPRFDDVSQWAAKIQEARDQ